MICTKCGDALPEENPNEVLCLDCERNLCQCGSGEYKDEHNDCHGIFLFYACWKCYKSKASKFRPEVFTGYDLEEGA